MAILVTTIASTQAIASVSIVEGKAVKLSASGQRYDLPTAALASTNDVEGVFVAFFPVDNFARPTPRGLYTAPYWVKRNDYTLGSYGDPSDTQTYDRIPRSMWKEPTVLSGELVALHKGKIGLTSGAFIDSAGIKVPGSWVRVGVSGLFQTTSTASEAVGHVEKYDAANGVLYVSIKN